MIYLEHLAKQWHLIGVTYDSSNGEHNDNNYYTLAWEAVVNLNTKRHIAKMGGGMHNQG